MTHIMRDWIVAGYRKFRQLPQNAQCILLGVTIASTVCFVVATGCLVSSAMNNLARNNISVLMAKEEAKLMMAAEEEAIALAKEEAIALAKEEAIALAEEDFKAIRAAERGVNAELTVEQALEQFHKELEPLSVLFTELHSALVITKQRLVRERDDPQLADQYKHNLAAHQANIDHNVVVLLKTKARLSAFLSGVLATADVDVRKSEIESFRSQFDDQIEKYRMAAKLPEAKRQKELAHQTEMQEYDAPPAKPKSRWGPVKSKPKHDDLTLLPQSVEATSGQFGVGEITGTVINYRSNKLTYAQITFNLYDASGAQVGSAMANITGLEPGGRWKFKAVALTSFTKYKLSELTGY